MRGGGWGSHRGWSGGCARRGRRAAAEHARDGRGGWNLASGTISFFVMPAKAGTQSMIRSEYDHLFSSPPRKRGSRTYPSRKLGQAKERSALGSRFRGNDERGPGAGLDPRFRGGDEKAKAGIICLVRTPGGANLTSDSDRLLSVAPAQAGVQGKRPVPATPVQARACPWPEQGGKLWVPAFAGMTKR